MKISAVAYIAVGAVAVAGALLTAWLLLILGDAASLLSSADAASLPGTDAAGLQESASLLGTIVVFGWLWVLCVLASGALAVKSGVEGLRRKK